MNTCKHEHTQSNIGVAWGDDCPYCRIDELEQQLAEVQSELALSIKERIELGGKLSRYQGGVEMKGVVTRSGLIELYHALPDTLYNQLVSVLVMPKEAE